MVLAGILAATGFAAAEPGYLPRVGPAPLRFRAEMPAATHHFVLPPAEPEPVAAVASPVPFGPMPELPPPTETAAITNQATSAVPDAIPPEDIVSPQMLIKFFNKSTNGAPSSVITPYGFTPPRVSEPPASKATYSTGP